MQDLSTPNGCHLVCLQRFHCQCPTIRIHELDLVPLAGVVHKDHSPNIAGFQAMRGQILEQRHGIQFFEHVFSHTPSHSVDWIRGNQLRRGDTIGQHPNGQHAHSPTAGCFEFTHADKLASKHTTSFGHLSRCRQSQQSLTQQVCLLSSKAQTEKELSLTASPRMIRVEQILDQFRLRDDGLIGERKAHPGARLHRHRAITILPVWTYGPIPASVSSLL
jgi:hypothetical protein